MFQEFAKKYDKRTVDRYMDKGMVKGPEFKDFLTKLPNDEANLALVEINMDDEDLMDDDLMDGEDEMDDAEEEVDSESIA